MNEKILVDSDFLIANAKKDDPLHKKAKSLARNLNTKNVKFYCLNLVVQEATTVISKRIGMNAAKIFYSQLGKFIRTFIISDENLERKAWQIFLKQTKKGTSFTDCTNLATLKEYNLDKIASFDTFYPKELLVTQ